MDVTKDVVLEALGRVVTRGITLTALADDLGYGKQQYARLREVLEGLRDEGTVTNVRGGGWALAPTGRSGDRKGKLPWKAISATPPEPEAAPRIARNVTKAKKVVEAKKDAISEGDGEPRTARARAAARSVAAPAPAAAEVPAVPGEDKDRVTGRITVHPAGYGFVQVDDATDVFVPAKYRGDSLDGDRVVVTTWLGYKGTEGRVVEVVARGRARLTGTLVRAGRMTYVAPDDPRIAADYGRVVLDATPPGQPGEAVVVEITRYPSPVEKVLAGRVVKVLGDPDDPRTEIEKIIACSGVPVEFPDDAATQALQTSQEVGVEDRADRIDLRDRRFCTIDPETARDFDDALCIEDGPHGGTRVWVAVADVSHYVRWDDALDQEAQLRGVSVYLPDRVIPMLPFELSSAICSLNPHVDRCAMVVRLDYREDGTLADTGYAAAVIRSQARLDYPGVAAALRGDLRGRREIYRPWLPELERLDALAQVLRKGRRERGALDLDLPEAKVVLDADDPRLVRDVVRAKADPDVKQAYELVEEFMIAANEAVGRFFRARDATSVWRVHAPPQRERVELLAELLGAYGIAVDVELAMTSIGMKQVLQQVADSPASRSLSYLVLRSLKQAVWDTVPVGHFGLASGDYLHFTSPIRRYPDLLVHRLLKHHLHREGQASGGGYAKPPPPLEKLTELASSSSGHERRAMEAERESVSMYRAYLVRDQIGEQFTGVVSAVTSFGAFVEIDEPYVEGLIRKESLGDHVAFDDIHMSLSNRRTGQALTLGDPVQVEITDVSVARRRVELTLVAVKRSTTPRPRALDIATGTDYAQEPRVGLAKRRRAGRAAVEASVGASPERRSAARPKLKVSHRRGDDDRGPAKKGRSKGRGR